MNAKPKKRPKLGEYQHDQDIEVKEELVYKTKMGPILKKSIIS